MPARIEVPLFLTPWVCPRCDKLVLFGQVPLIWPDACEDCHFRDSMRRNLMSEPEYTRRWRSIELYRAQQALWYSQAWRAGHRNMRHRVGEALDIEGRLVGAGGRARRP